MSSREQLGLADGQLAAECRALAERLGVPALYVMACDPANGLATSAGFRVEPDFVIAALTDEGAIRVRTNYGRPS